MPWTPPSVEELAGAFPQLEVLELIGQGGMGAVYKARQKSLGRMVALKILAPQHAANPDFAERFSREAQVLAEVNHPNIVTVHDFGRAGEFYFLLMEHVDGINLRQAMMAGRLTPQQALAIVPPICEALQFAHNRGIVHRDIKPENLLLDKTGRIKIADFGIARLLRNGPEEMSAGRGDMARPAELTQDSVLGTPQYMAPEQRDRPATVDHRADIFSLGVVLYEMLTGELPGPILQPPSSRVQIDVRLDEIVLRALERNPELRFQSASELGTEVVTVSQVPQNQAEDVEKSERVDWTLWSPSQSVLVARICSHMTDGEKSHARRFGAVFGVWNAATFSLPLFAFMSWPQPFCWIYAGLVLATGLAFYPFWMRMQRDLLCNTAWAKQQQITPDQIQRKKWTGRMIAIAVTITLGFVCLVMIAAFGFGAVKVLPEFLGWNAVSADILTQQGTVDGGQFAFHHEVKCPAGWNAWLTVECAHLSRADDAKDVPREPVIVRRYQAKLEGRGRVRIPLDYLPTSDEGRDKMLASILPWEGNRSILKPNIGVALLAYTTESGMNVCAMLKILPEGQSPDSLLINAPAGTTRFQNIEAPVRPNVAPFEGAYDQGKVELAVLGPHPSKDRPCWKPNGEPATEWGIPEHGGKSWSAGKVIKEIVVRVHSETGLASQPVLRFPEKSGISGMGTSFYQPSVDDPFGPDDEPFTTLIQSIACPPEAQQTTVLVGVADGGWHNSLSFERHENQLQFGGSKSGGTEGAWEGSVRTTRTTGETVPLSFRYSRRDDYETRLVYERADGKLIRLSGDGSDGGHSLVNSLTTLPVQEFASIRRFHLQSRPYQWIEFRNVSLELGHHTTVEVHGANAVDTNPKR